MKEAYVFIGSYNHEGDDILGVFTDRAVAQELVDNSTRRAAYMAHIGRPYASHDSYRVEVMPVYKKAVW